ncbi:MAG: xanthine dehydrogenase family protein molybdopterin-binding subunit [Rhodospirillaceae bacterium]|jgi:aerobic carbon-monoxide dehydrogenase large subunit|nr:xanthine dehydrogenase family protein molybdopterin-binding subunit [Rhodospirillaceae bacterium]MBT3928790.1 xanthine dehydrogenase family protein molybdopterin-binding subunit [Rhodospirillaceae bacterium]MBT5778046.1 xanthine dehydrogenase family protein molybdopterin-binding subunit [Rhodospirillaceae bacterium]
MSVDKKGAWVGTKFNRKEDHRLTTGKGRYLADLSLPGMLHLTFVRSERAHATINSIDTSKAEALPGIVAVVTGEGIKDKILPMPQPVVQPGLPAKFPKHWPLAVGKVKFHGEPIAAIVSRDKYVGADAAELIEVDYTDLPYVSGPEQALESGAPLVHDDWDDNLIFEMGFTGGDTEESQAQNDAEVEEIMQTADIVVKERFRVHRCGMTPMETRGVLASWDESDGLTAQITTQRPHIDRLALSDILEIPAEKMRIVAPRDQGGGFGVKAPFYREPILVCYLAKTLGRPIRWVESRQEHLMAVSQERDQINDLEVAATKDGKLLAVRNRGIADCGDGCQGVYWGFVMPFLGAVELPNGYTWEKGDVKVKVAVTNKSCLSPARAFGEFPTRFAMERAVDMVANRCGMEPAELRRKNLIPELPYTSVCGEYMDSGDFLKVWDNLMEQADLPAFRKQQEEARKEGRYIGIGFGLGVELSGVSSELMVPMENQPGYGAATIRLDARGKVQVFEGDAPQGQGHETTAAQAVAHAFGIHPNDVVVTTGDTGTTPFGSGTIGARMGSYFVSAAVEAAEFLKKKIARFMAHDMALTGATEEDFEFVEGEIIYLKDTNIRQNFRDACERNIMAPINLPEGESAGLEHTAFFEAAMPMIAFNADFCVVEVNPDDGQFKMLSWTSSEDVGQIINPQIVEGQMQGAIVQGISNTIFEEFIYDENGQQLTADFENYKLATAADVPDLKITHAPTPCPHTPLGTRGIGEGRPSDVPGVITNAVCDALSPFGIEITELPLRPNKIWHLIQEAKAKQAAD